MPQLFSGLRAGRRIRGLTLSESPVLHTAKSFAICTYITRYR
jgi:hypothetical protein